MRAKYKPHELLTASEIARYVYCERAWAYDRKYIRPYRLRRWRQWLMVALLIAAVVSVVVWRVVL